MMKLGKDEILNAIAWQGLENDYDVDIVKILTEES